MITFFRHKSLPSNPQEKVVLKINILSYSDRQELCQILSFEVIPFLFNHEWSKYGNKVLTILSLRSGGPNESKVYCIGGRKEMLSSN